MSVKTLRAIVCLSALSLGFQAGVAKAQYTTLQSGTDIGSRFQLGTQVYMKGSPIKQDQALALAKDLKQYPHWVVVLVDDCRNESFNVKAHGTLYGYSAVEAAAGVDLFNNPDFQGMIDESTGLSKGSALLISFDSEDANRGISAFTSAQHERYGLSDERTWGNGIDQIAINHLRDGRKVSRAVLESIGEYERRLTNAVEGEARQAHEKAERLEREKRDVQAEIAGAQSALTSLVSRQQEFNKANSALTGNITNPNFQAWAAQLENASQALTRGDIGLARDGARNVKMACEGHQKALDEYPKAKEKILALKARLEKSTGHQFAEKVKALHTKATNAIDKAKSEWERGDAAFNQSLSEAEQYVAAVESGLVSAVTMAKAAKFAMRTFLFALIAAVAIVLSIFRHKTRSIRNQIMEEILAWENSLAEKNTAMRALDARKTALLGDQKSAVTLTGKTGELAKQTIEDMDYMNLMWSRAYTILGEVKGMLQSSALQTRFYNFFFAGNYVIARQKMEVVTFNPSDDLSLVFDSGTRRPEEVLWRPIKSFKPFSLPFDKLMEEFGKRGKRSTEALGIIESAMHSAGSTIGNLIRMVDEIASQAGALESSYGPHAATKAKALVANTVPSWRGELDKAKTASLLDPVSALEQSATVELEIKLAKSVLEELLSAAKEVIPNLRKVVSDLEREGISSPWVDQGIATIVSDAGVIFEKLAKSDVTEGVSPVAQAFVELAQKVGEAASLLAIRVNKAKPALAAAKETVTKCRVELAAELSLQQNQILVEEDANPDQMLAQAEGQLAVSAEALGSGELSKARNALDEMNEQIHQAESMVKATREAFKAYGEKRSAIVAKNEALAGRVGPVEGTLATLVGSFAPEALLVDVGSEKKGGPQESITDNVSEVQNAAAERDNRLAEATSALAEGRILEANDLLDQAVEANVFIEGRLSEVTQREQLLFKVVRGNGEKQAAFDAQIEELHGQMKDRLVRTSTVTSFSGCKNEFLRVKGLSAAEQPNPFAVALLLENVGKVLLGIYAKIKTDKGLHSEAERSVRAARVLHDGLKANLETAQRDSVPDSRALQSMPHSLGEINSALKRVEGDLGVAHADWAEIDSKADAAFADLSKLKSLLQGEVESGRRASEAISQAAGKIREASSWSGSYGVTIGYFTSSDLEQARRALNSGDYASASRLAEAAFRQAANAIQEAQAREARERREAEERKREAQAAAEAARRRSYESSRSSFSSRSSGGSKSTFSGFRSGGSRSSSSGFKSGGSRSKW